MSIVVGAVSLAHDVSRPRDPFDAFDSLDRFDSFDSFDSSDLPESCDSLDWLDPSEPPLPAWIVEAQEASLREDLAASACRPIDGSALMLLRLLDPEGLALVAQRGASAGRGECCGAGSDDGGLGSAAGSSFGVSADVAAQAAARTLLDGIVVAQRIADYANAIQQRLLAAFCRPGVAVPVPEVIDLGGEDVVEGAASAADKAGASVATAADATVTAGAGAGVTADNGAAVVAADAAAGGRITIIPPRPASPPVLREPAMKAAAAEVACALHLAPITARIRCENATEFVDCFSATLAAQQRGEIDPYRARMLLERASVLARELRTRVEGRVLPFASSLTSAAFRRLIDREVIAADPAAARRREEQAKARRDVFASRAEDGTGVFTALVSAGDAELAYRLLDAVAESLTNEQLAQDRTRPQLRADAFTDLFRTLADTGQVVIAHTGALAGPCAGPGSDDSVASSVDVPAAESWIRGGACCPAGPLTGVPAAGLRPGDGFGDSVGSLDGVPAEESCVGDGAACPAGRPTGVPAAGLRSGDGSGDSAASSAGVPTAESCLVGGASCPVGAPTGVSAAGSRPRDGAGDSTGDTETRPHVADGAACPGCGATGGSPAAADECASDRPSPAWMGQSLPEGRPGAPVSVRRPVALNVYLDVETLANLADRPGEIGGFGAVTAETARALAASADTIRAVLVRPAGGDRACGTILDAGRTVYRPPDKTADYVIARDRTCCFPGCRMPARRCDLDHRHPYDSDGETCPCNLDTLCRTHHRLKTFTSWSAVRDADTDRLVWTSPLGRTYRTEQPHLLLDGNQDGNAEPLTSDIETDTESGRPDTTITDDDPPPF